MFRAFEVIGLLIRNYLIYLFDFFMITCNKLAVMKFYIVHIIAFCGLLKFLCKSRDIVHANSLRYAFKRMDGYFVISDVFIRKFLFELT